MPHVTRNNFGLQLSLAEKDNQVVAASPEQYRFNHPDSSTPAFPTTLDTRCETQFRNAIGYPRQQ